MAKDTFYFSHDYNSRNDEKIKSLIFKHGLRGYGIFWAIIEDLYNNANELQTNYERIAFELREDVIIVKSVIEEFELFVINDNYFGSKSVQKRLDDRAEKSKKAKESVKLRWQKHQENKEIDTNVLPTHNDSNTIKERKVKEIKEEYSFERFWDLYNKKEGRTKCLSKFDKLKQTEIDKIFETLPTYIKNTPDVKYRKNPLTYLNGKHWEDEINLTSTTENEPHWLAYGKLHNSKQQ